MINVFEVGDYKGHQDTKILLGRLTALVGDNGSGKTSILDALMLQSRSAEDIGIFESKPADLLRRGAERGFFFTSKGETSGVDWQTVLQIRRSNKTHGVWELDATGRIGRVNVRAHEENGTSTGDWPQLADAFGTARLYRLSAARVAAASYSEDLEPEIKSDGKYTAVALAAMKLGNDEAFGRVEESMRRLVPSVKRIRIRPANVRIMTTGRVRDTVVGSKIYFDFVGAENIPAHGASDGTLILLSLLTILYGPYRPNLILLDDFDHALHPRAQMVLVRLILELLDLKQFLGVQVVIATHSPYMLDELQPADVQALALRDNGTVAAKRLSDHPDAERTRGTLKAGQLWSLDPEREWVLKD